MRLRTCLAVELCAGLTLLGGLGVGAVYGVRAGAGYLADTEAAAATIEAPELAAAREGVRPLAGAQLHIDTLAPKLGTVFPKADEDLLAPLRGSKVVRVKLNHGGTSLSLRLDFEDGARCAFKPEQTFFQSNPRKEIAAYRIDRLLGIGHVAPAVARSFSVDELVAAVDPSQRGAGTQKMLDDIVARGGRVSGECQWWIPEIIDAKIEGERVDMDEGIVRWHRYLRAGAPIPDDALEMTAQISDVILFDFVIDNVDRWTLSNTKGTPDGHVLYFMDNTLSLTPYPTGLPKSHIYLHRSEKFSRRLVARLRTLTRDEVEKALVDHGPLGALLQPDEVTALLARRDAALAYIDGLIADHGEDQVLVFP
ncbi:MAG TPA: hypothetical protein VL463_12900 [Kofleriaceae bacterium]|nr:hypothetical protein [Kofleriaceae bacterium]